MLTSPPPSLTLRAELEQHLQAVRGEAAVRQARPALGCLVDWARRGPEEMAALSALAQDPHCEDRTRSVGRQALHILAGSQGYEEAGVEGTLYLVALPVFLKAPALTRNLHALPPFESLTEVAASAEYALGLPASALRFHGLPTRLASAEAWSIEHAHAAAIELRAGGLAKGWQPAILELGAQQWESVVWLGTLFLADDDKALAGLLRLAAATPNLMRWKQRTEAMLEEELFMHCGDTFEVRTFPPLLMQDAGLGCRLLGVKVGFYEALRQHRPQTSAVRMSYAAGVLAYELVDGRGRVLHSAESELPETPDFDVWSNVGEMVTQQGLTLMTPPRAVG